MSKSKPVNKKAIQKAVYNFVKKLSEAIQEDNPDKVKELLGNPNTYTTEANISRHELLGRAFKRNHPGEDTLLEKAIKGQNVDILIQLLNAAKDIKMLEKMLVHNSKQGDSLIHVAVKLGNLGSVEILLNYAKDIGDNNETLKKLLSLKDKSNDNVIDLAVKDRKFDKLIKLLDAIKYIKNDDDDDVNNILSSFNNSKEANIYVATVTGDYNKLSNLLDKIKNFTRKLQCIHHIEKIETPLYKAVKKDNITNVVELLNTASSVKDNNATLKYLILSHNGFNGTALHAASQLHNPTIAKKLLDTAKDIGDNNETLKKLLFARTKSNATALHEASYYWNVQAVTLIASAARDIGDNNETLKKLLLSHTDLDDTCLHRAVQDEGDSSRSLETVEEIVTIAKGVNDENITIKELLLSLNKSGENASYKASQMSPENHQILHLLLVEARDLCIIRTLIDDIYDKCEKDIPLHLDRIPNHFIKTCQDLFTKGQLYDDNKCVEEQKLREEKLPKEENIFRDKFMHTRGFLPSFNILPGAEATELEDKEGVHQVDHHKYFDIVDDDTQDDHIDEKVATSSNINKIPLDSCTLPQSIENNKTGGWLQPEPALSLPLSSHNSSSSNIYSTPREQIQSQVETNDHNLSSGVDINAYCLGGIIIANKFFGIDTSLSNNQLIDYDPLKQTIENLASNILPNLGDYNVDDYNN